MPSTIYLLRHAESHHNVTKDFSLRDPGLTSLGTAQSAALGSTFPALDTVSILLASPLTRTIETTLAAFGPLLNVDAQDGAGPKARLILDPHLQERSALPCDTGSPVEALKVRFPQLEGVIGEGVPEGKWFAKEGIFAEDDESVKARAKKVRERLAGLVKELESGGGARKDVVVVTHGVFMKFLAEDEEVDLPRPGYKAYRAEGEGEGVKLVPV